MGRTTAAGVVGRCRGWRSLSFAGRSLPGIAERLDNTAHPSQPNVRKNWSSKLGVTHAGAPYGDSDWLILSSIQMTGVHAQQA